MLTWYERDDTENVFLIPNGMPVAERRRDYYWMVRDKTAKILEANRAAGIAPPYTYTLIDADNRVVGSGTFDTADDADDIAWLGCFFGETTGFSVAMPSPLAGESYGMRSGVVDATGKLQERP
ncbi:MAG: hypothetical protein Q8M24_08360 [Pseudolabrys sp.]|nr:hypothetical protein [Pseudolabrys sp.]